VDIDNVSGEEDPGLAAGEPKGFFQKGEVVNAVEKLRQHFYAHENSRKEVRRARKGAWDEGTGGQY